MSTIVGYRIYHCEFCRHSSYFESSLAEHLKRKHNIDIYNEDANKGYAGDVLMVSDAVIPTVNLRKFRLYYACTKCRYKHYEESKIFGRHLKYSKVTEVRCE